MNYKEKYNAALERARELQENSNGMILKKWLWGVFPELKESEDERIRKEIHIYLDWLDGRKDYTPKGIYSIKDMIAWLEKQGEPKTLNADDMIAWLKPYSVIVGNIIDDFKKNFGL